MLAATVAKFCPQTVVCGIIERYILSSKEYFLGQNILNIRPTDVYVQKSKINYAQNISKTFLPKILKAFLKTFQFKNENLVKN